MPVNGSQPWQTVTASIGELGRRGLLFKASSRIFSTPAFPAGAGPDFANAVAVFETDLPAGEVLAILHEVEALFGRMRKARWEARGLDLDLLAVGNRITPNLSVLQDWMQLTPELQRQEAPPELILPHPRLHERGFVLMPFDDVSPDWRHPVLGLSVAEMLKALPTSALEGIFALDVPRPDGSGSL